MIEERKGEIKMNKKVNIHGIPMDLGVDIRGVDMGPSAMHIAGIGVALKKMGYYVEEQQGFSESRMNLGKDDSRAKYAKEINDVCEKLFQKAVEYKEKNSIPIFVGGDHSIAMGTVSGISHYFQQQKKQLGLIWFDAHGDMNTPDISLSGNVHGMPLAALLHQEKESFSEVASRCQIQPKNVSIVGVRDLDSQEQKALINSGVGIFSMKAIDNLGMAEVTRQAIKRAMDGTSGFHLSFDIDGLDPSIAPGVSTPVPGGVNFREAHLFMELLWDSKGLQSMDIVELNPIRDKKNITAEVMVKLVESALGKSII